MTPCVSCRRHVRSTDATCPFCGGAPIEREPRALVPPQLSRAGRLALEITLGGTLTACAGEVGDRHAKSDVVVVLPAPSSVISASEPAATGAPSGSASAGASAAPPGEGDPNRRVVPVYGANEILILERVYFEPKSTLVPKESVAMFETITQLMAAYPKSVVACVGHALPSEAKTVRVLAAARAKAVCAALVKAGAPMKRLRERVAPDEPKELVKLSTDEQPRFRSTTFSFENEDGSPVSP